MDPVLEQWHLQYTADGTILSKFNQQRAHFTFSLRVMCVLHASHVHDISEQEGNKQGMYRECTLCMDTSLLDSGVIIIDVHYSQKLKEHFDIMIFIERYPLKRCQGCVKLIASKVNCFLNINDLSEVQLCMSSNSWTWECPHTKDGADHVPLIFLSSVLTLLMYNSWTGK